MFADIDFVTPISPSILVMLGVIIAIALLIARALLGPPAGIARRWGLLAIRVSILVVIVLLIFNPVRVREAMGPMERPEVFYLLDGSQSMAVGDKSTRWDDALSMMRAASDATRNSSHADVKLFRFGERLSAIEDPSQLGLDLGNAPSNTTRVRESREVTVRANSQDRHRGPSDTDTQLMGALRQAPSRFGRKPPAAIVLFSDGRARDDIGAEKIADSYRKLDVPIHVAPLGATTKGGDISIVAVVVPPRVRKFSEVEAHVFLRSFGYDGRRAEVRLDQLGSDGKMERKLSTGPLTLHSGFQSITLPFRTDLQTRQLLVSVSPQDDELSLDNNEFHASVSIDRTKIRVLYLEGSGRQITTTQRGNRTEYRGPFSDLQRALTEDDDIECVVVTVPYGAGRLTRIVEYGGLDANRGFPETVAELAAFDAIILSNVAASALTDTQLKWIEQWIGQRGGGLCMVGGERSFAAGGWNETQIARILPVELLDRGDDWVPSVQVPFRPEATASGHAIWNIVSDEKQNREIIGNVPGFQGANRLVAAKPNLATVLATTSALPATVASDGVTGFIGSVRAARNALFGAGSDAGIASISGNPEDQSASADSPMPALVVGRYGKGRTMAMATCITAPWANDFLSSWGAGDNRYYAKFWRNVIYWLTENSATGRRRLLASVDKRFYRPGETITLQSAAFDESATQTKAYRVVATIEPQGALNNLDSDYSPLRWPDNLTRTSGEQGPFMVWGEEFEIPSITIEKEKPGYGLKLAVGESLSGGAANQSLRLELTAYEDLTQVDSTSIDIQILHDPFEQQNPFPDHELLKRIADRSGGQVLPNAQALAEVLKDVPVRQGPMIVSKSPLWSNWWLWGLLVLLLSSEWIWRRAIGLA